MINRNIAVIGAGRSGLVAAKYGIQEGFNVTIYEKNEAIGGTWRYTEKTGKDEYGLDIHTAMYKQLRYFIKKKNKKKPKQTIKI